MISRVVLSIAEEDSEMIKKLIEILTNYPQTPQK